MNMSNKDCYIGILANADSSLTGLDLGYGFRIESKPLKEFKKFIAEYTDFEPFDKSDSIWNSQLRMFRFLSDEEQIFYMFNSNISDLSIPRKDGSEPIYTGYGEDIFEIIDYENSYLQPVLRIMRLFKEGNISLIWQLKSGGDSVSMVSLASSNYLLQNDDVYHLKKTERNELEFFIQKMDFPLKKTFLELSFENFETSYEVRNKNLSFISLMISLEVLFNSGSGNVKNSISKRTAILLGNNSNHSKQIFKDVKKLYKKRSELIHNGNAELILKEDVIKLRNYVRESIKKAITFDKEKNELLKKLDSQEPGEGSIKR